MRRENVKSSSIKSIGYDESSQILEIEFLNETIYYYFDVPKTIFMDLMSADSKGKILQQNKKQISLQENISLRLFYCHIQICLAFYKDKYK